MPKCPPCREIGLLMDAIRLKSQGKVNFGCTKVLSRCCADLQLITSNQVNRQTKSNRTFSSRNCDVVPGPSLLRTSVHRPRPSLMFMPGLRSLPFWSHYNGTENLIAYQDPTVQYTIDLLQRHVQVFKTEYEQVSTMMIPSDYHPSTDHSVQLHKGQWDWHSYLLKGKLQNHFLQHFPETSKVLQQLRDHQILFEYIPFGYTFFSTLHPQSKIVAHTAPTNLRLRIHIPLVVPLGTASDDSTYHNPSHDKNTNTTTTTSSPPCAIRVGHVQYQWYQDIALVFDDSYEHEVWNHTNQKRVILLVDIWHPDIAHQERHDIVGMFQHAQQKGWWSN